MTRRVYERVSWWVHYYDKCRERFLEGYFTRRWNWHRIQVIPVPIRQEDAFKGSIPVPNRTRWVLLNGIIRFSIAKTMVTKPPKYRVFSWNFSRPIRCQLHPRIIKRNEDSGRSTNGSSRIQKRIERFLK
jgi:hypothetical protein